MRVSRHQARGRGYWLGSVMFSLAMAVLSGVLSAQQAPLRLVSTAWSPFTNDSGHPRLALDLVEAALGRIGIKSSTTVVDAGAFTTALMSGPFDGSAAAWMDAERERTLLFSQPYLENRLILVARHGTDVSATALAQLAGKRVALVGGYSYGDAVEQSGATFVRSRAEEDSIKLLLDSQVDYALMDELVVQSIVSAYAEQARTRLQIGATPLVTRPLYFAVRRAMPNADQIIGRFNAQIRGMIADHTYHQLLHLDWIQADVDGDGVPEWVPRSNHSGATEPTGAYSLFSPSTPTASVTKAPSRFMVDGSIYDGWKNIPERYKIDDPKPMTAAQSSTVLLRISW